MKKNLKNKKKEIQSDYYKIKELKDTSNILNVLREEKDVYKSFNKIMRMYEEGIEDVALVFVCDVHPVIIQQLSLFCSFYSIKFYLFPSTLSGTLKVIYDEKVKVIGIKKESRAFERIITILESCSVEEKDVYEI